MSDRPGPTSYHHLPRQVMIFPSFVYKPVPHSPNDLGIDLQKQVYAVMGLEIDRFHFTLQEWMRIPLPSHNLLRFLQAPHEIRQITCAQSECGTGLAWRISHRRILSAYNTILAMATCNPPPTIPSELPSESVLHLAAEHTANTSLHSF